MFEDKILETASIVLMAVVWIELLIITLSYYLAYRLKKTFGVLAFLIYFVCSTLIYFFIFSRLIFQSLIGACFFINCATFFIIISFFRVISASILLLSIWKQPPSK